MHVCVCVCACVQDGQLCACVCVCVCERERERERSEVNKRIWCSHCITLASKQVNYPIIVSTQYVFTWPSNRRVAIEKFDIKQYPSISTLLKDSIAHHWSTNMVLPLPSSFGLPFLKQWSLCQSHN